MLSSPFRFGCGFIGPLVWEPELPSPKYLKSQQTQCFISLVWQFYLFPSLPNIYDVQGSRQPWPIGLPSSGFIVALCSLSSCLNSTITGRRPGEHDGAIAARLQRAGEVPRRQRRVHAACSTWGIHTPAGAHQPLCPLSNAHEAHVQQKALDAHFSCG